MYRKNGFTLIEIMVAVAIVGILTTVACSSYLSSIRKAKRAEGRAALMDIMQQQEKYYSQHTTYIAFNSSSTGRDERSFKWYSANDPSESSYEISAEACANEAMQTCIKLIAKPGTDKVNSSYKDPECGALTFSSTGEKSADGKNCW
jgi:type IV pilus assembly protein PilE